MFACDYDFNYFLLERNNRRKPDTCLPVRKHISAQIKELTLVISHLAYKKRDFILILQRKWALINIYALKDVYRTSESDDHSTCTWKKCYQLEIVFHLSPSLTKGSCQPTNRVVCEGRVTVQVCLWWQGEPKSVFTPQEKISLCLLSFLHFSQQEAATTSPRK